VLEVWERLSGAIARQGVRFVRPEKLHLTLAFLSNVDESNLPSLIAALDDGVCGAPFELHLDGLGCFPDMRRPRVIWVGFGGDTGRVADLAGKVAKAARPFAPELDEKPFAAHVTLARINPGSKEIGRMLGHMDLLIPPAVLPVGGFSLIHSKPDGAYETARRFILKADARPRNRQATTSAPEPS